jgi:hypothetical protein
MRLMPIGRLAIRDRLGSFRHERRLGTGERRIDVWRQLDPTEEAVARVLVEGGIFVEATGHTIAGDILAWYAFHEGAFYLGPPLSESLSERGTIVQWFEGGQLRVTQDGVSLAPLVAELAARLGIETAPFPRGDLPVYDEQLFWIADTPNPLGDPHAPGPSGLRSA